MTTSPVVFDVFGTLFDVHSVTAEAEALFPGQGHELSRIWRTAQIDYTRILSLSGRYRDFWEITRDALVFAGKSLGHEPTQEQISALMSAYQKLTPYPETQHVLSQLRAGGHGLAILSNGTPGMLTDLIAAAGLKGMFDHVLSADAVRAYKTAPEVYALAPEAFECPAREIVFVSSNGWDICGAGWFGFQTFWVNRNQGVLDNLGVRPSAEGRDLNVLLEPFTV